ncbi:uncharacterized protein [Rutidosis leptorrhynchoides]|uniref:uncharacterized protein n=1 Tax=Rutidosis leptorrhynchoides TaxID=125765 RepID=UPI003A98F704
MIAGFCCDESKKDGWKWIWASDEIFTVRKLSLILDENSLAIGNNSTETIRNSLVPKKVEIFVWRTLKKRLPVRIERVDLHSVRCPLCDDEIESLDHTFIFCSHAIKVWDRVFNWWGLGNLSNLSFNEILRGNAGVPMSNFGRKVWQAVEWVSAYHIWINRNNMVFHGKSWNPPVALNVIQSKSFEWISRRSKGKNIDWLIWLSNPNSYFTL